MGQSMIGRGDGEEAQRWAQGRRHAMGAAVALSPSNSSLAAASLHPPCIPCWGDSLYVFIRAGAYGTCGAVGWGRSRKRIWLIGRAKEI